jgi:hypothetical protein
LFESQTFNSEATTQILWKRQWTSGPIAISMTQICLISNIYFLAPDPFHSIRLCQLWSIFSAWIARISFWWRLDDVTG